MHGGVDIIRHCTRCGQQLVFPTGDLRRRFRCPRCFADHIVGDLVAVDVALPAIPASDRAPMDVHTAPMPALMIAAPSIENDAATVIDPLMAARVYQDVARRPEQQLANRGSSTTSPFRQAVLDVRAAVIWLLDQTSAADRRLDGRRLLALVGSAALATVFSWSDSVSLDTIGTGIFVGVIAVLTLARIGAIRDSDGMWRPGSAIIRAWGSASDAWQDLALGAFRKQIGWGGLFGVFAVAVGLLMSASARVLSQVQHAFLLTNDDLKTAITICNLGTWLAFFGGLLWWWRRSVARAEAMKQGLLVENETQQRELVSAASKLPLILDANDAGSLKAAAERLDQPLIKQLLQVLENWHPPAFTNEARYEKALHRELLKAIAGAAPKRQSRVGGRGRDKYGIVDILLGDAILIELKHGWKDTDRALSQVERYSGYCEDRGLVVLLLCGLAGDEASIARERIESKVRLSRPLYPWIAVFAARRT